MRVPYEWLIIASVFAGQLAYAQYPDPGYGYQDPYAFQQYGAPDQNSLYAELLPADRSSTFPEDFGTVSLAQTKEMFRGTWGRLEYLHGNISHEGATTLGAPIFGPSASDPTVIVDYPDPSQQFPIIFTDGITTALAEVPTTRGTRWKNAQGMRGSFGIPIAKAFSIEGRAWGYEEQAFTLDTPRIPPLQVNGPFSQVNSTFLATTLTTDGVPGTTVILYDAGFSSSYTSSIKAGDVSLVFNWKNPDEGLRVQPILGYRHEEYVEGLGFGGTFDNTSGAYVGAGTFAPQSNWIQSNAVNHRDMLAVGLRTEWQRGNLTLGMQERMAVGSNIAKTSVYTSNLREPGSIPGTVDDPALTRSFQRSTTVAPTLDLDVYAHIQMNHWLSFRVGYNLIWMGRVAAADQSIRFNEVSDGLGGTLPDVGSSMKYSNRTVSALTIGGEIILP